MKAGTERTIISVLPEGAMWRWKMQHQTTSGEVSIGSGLRPSQDEARIAAFQAAQQASNDNAEVAA